MCSPVQVRRNVSVVLVQNDQDAEHQQTRTDNLQENSPKSTDRVPVVIHPLTIHSFNSMLPLTVSRTQMLSGTTGSGIVVHRMPEALPAANSRIPPSKLSMRGLLFT